MEARNAKAVSVASCQHGHVFIRFHDENGEIIASACMDIEAASDFVENTLDEMQKAVEAVVASGAHSSSAETAH
jgi:hypothetical protein